MASWSVEELPEQSDLGPPAGLWVSSLVLLPPYIAILYQGCFWFPCVAREFLLSPGLRKLAPSTCDLTALGDCDRSQSALSQASPLMHFRSGTHVQGLPHLSSLSHDWVDHSSQPVILRMILTLLISQKAMEAPS